MRLPWKQLLLATSLHAGACHAPVRADDQPAAGEIAPTSGKTTSETGEVPGGGSAGAVAPNPVDIDLGVATASSTIRRLSRHEIGNAVEQLIGLHPEALSEVPADGSDSGFDRVVEDQTISVRHLEGFRKLADEIAAHLLRTLHTGAVVAVAEDCQRETQPVAADPTAQHRPCVDAFLQKLGPRALRRPLLEGELDRFLALYDAANTYGQGLELVAHALFRHPSFLYLVEEGAGAAESGVLALSAFEVAARLSFGLCETLPDDVLWQAAERGELGEAEAIEEQARRMLGLPCARATLGRFFAQWLRYAEAPSLSRDPEAFPRFDPEVARAIARETDAFVSHVLWESDGTLGELFTADYAFVDPVSAFLHGLDAQTDLGRVALSPHRRGILTQPSLLAVTSKEGASSPVKRGVYVLERILCQELPPPPTDLEIKTPARDDQKTSQERWEQHAGDPACAGCHSLIDPVGFALERFDAVGRYRETENGRPIDDRGGLPSFGIAHGELAGGAALAEAVAAEPALAQCFARHWLRNALGRMEAQSDAPALTHLIERVVDGGKLSELLPTIVGTEPFRTRRTAP